MVIVFVIIVIVNVVKVYVIIIVNIVKVYVITAIVNFVKNK